MYLLLAHTPAQAASSCIGHQRRLLKRTLLDRRPMRSPRVKQQLYEVAMTLKIHTSLVITLAVHSNSRGSSRSNLRKTQRTADKLKAYLVRKYNLAPRRIIARGFGERCPIAPNRTREGRQKNSRAEWWLPKGMKSPKSAFVSSTSIVAKKSPPRRISQRLRLFFASGTHKLRPAQRRTLQAWSHRIKTASEVGATS